MMSKPIRWYHRKYSCLSGAPPLMKNLIPRPKISWTGWNTFFRTKPSPRAFRTGAALRKNMKRRYLFMDCARIFPVMASKNSSHIWGAAGKIVIGLSARARMMSGPFREFCRTMEPPVTSGAMKVDSKA